MEEIDEEERRTEVIKREREREREELYV